MPVAYKWQRRLADPTPLGLFGFGITTVLLGFVNAGIIDASGSLGVVWACAIWVGGVAQVLAGVLEFVRGNTFGLVVFTIYGTFWLTVSLSEIIPAVSRGALAAPTHSVLALFFLMFFIFTAAMVLGSFLRPLVLQLLLFLLAITFMLLAIAEAVLAWGGGVTVLRVAGYFTIVTGFTAIYLAAAHVNRWPILDPTITLKVPSSGALSATAE
jgi:succinate-acetate transporter protein